MGSEAVLVSETHCKLYELGKFAGSWCSEEMHWGAGGRWARCDETEFLRRVRSALLGDPGEECTDEWDTPEAAFREVDEQARDIFTFLASVDWDCVCMEYDNHFWDVYESPSASTEKRAIDFTIMGNRYDAGRNLAPRKR